jgi:hypothetical protein
MEKELVKILGLEDKPKLWNANGFPRDFPFYEFDKDIYVVDDEFFTYRDINAIIFIDNKTNKSVIVSKEYVKHKCLKSLDEFKGLILKQLSKSNQTLITIPDLSL